MATELWFPGAKPGWLSHTGTYGCKVTAELDGIDIWYQGQDARQLEREFYRAAARTVLRRWMPWIAPPVAELRLGRCAGVEPVDDDDVGNPRSYSAEIAAHCKTPEEVERALAVRPGPAEPP